MKTTKMAVTAAAVIRASRTAFATERRVRRSSPAPKAWLVRTVKPVVRPIANPCIRNMMVPVEPTAARAV